jgi:hypothetical protein
MSYVRFIWNVRKCSGDERKKERNKQTNKQTNKQNKTKQNKESMYEECGFCLCIHAEKA